MIHFTLRVEAGLIAILDLVRKSSFFILALISLQFSHVRDKSAMFRAWTSRKFYTEEFRENCVWLLALTTRSQHIYIYPFQMRAFFVDCLVNGVNWQLGLWFLVKLCSQFMLHCFTEFSSANCRTCRIFVG